MSKYEKAMAQKKEVKLVEIYCEGKRTIISNKTDSVDQELCNFAKKVIGRHDRVANSAIEELTSQIDDLTNDIEEFTIKVDGLEDDNKSLKNKINGLDKEKSVLESEKVSLQKKVDKLQEEKKALQVDLDALID